MWGRLLGVVCLMMLVDVAHMNGMADDLDETALLEADQVRLINTGETWPAPKAKLAAAAPAPKQVVRTSRGLRV